VVKPKTFLVDQIYEFELLLLDLHYPTSFSHSLSLLKPAGVVSGAVRVVTEAAGHNRFSVQAIASQKENIFRQK